MRNGEGPRKPSSDGDRYRFEHRMGEVTRQTLEPITLNPPWTPEEEAGLRAMVQLGKRAAVIAKQLGRTEEAVRNRAGHRYFP